MTSFEVALITVIGALLTVMFSIIIIYLRAVLQKVEEVCHNLFVHKHTPEGDVLIPRESVR